MGVVRMLVLVAHPSHELLLHGWIRKTSAAVNILTDGSGHSGTPLLDASRELLQGAGGRAGVLFGRLTDRELYAMLLERNTSLLLSLVSELAAAMAAQRPDLVACDATEGYNPVHDLCRFIAGAAIELSGIAAKLYEYAVVGDPSFSGASGGVLTFELDDAAYSAKLDAAHRLGSRIPDIEDLLQRHGAEAYRREHLRPVVDWRSLGEDARPRYERFGEERVAAHRYARIIRRDEHLAPLRDALCRLVDERTCAF